jgi:hypothetical protein
MPVTQIDTNQWLVEFQDHITRQDGLRNGTVQIVVEITSSGIHMRPWRIVYHSPSGIVASPLPNTEPVWSAYRPLVLLELFTPLVIDYHEPYQDPAYSQDHTHDHSHDHSSGVGVGAGVKDVTTEMEKLIASLQSSRRKK